MFGKKKAQTLFCAVDASKTVVHDFRLRSTEIGVESYRTVEYRLYHKLEESEMLPKLEDHLTRLLAADADEANGEYDVDEEFAEHLKQDDEGKLEEMKQMHRAIVVGYCDYVWQRLKEYIGNPAAINALSEETCITLLERLDCELAALYGTCDKVKIAVGPNETAE